MYRLAQVDRGIYACNSPQLLCANNKLRCSTKQREMQRETYIRENWILGKRSKEILLVIWTQDKNKDEICRAGNVLVQCRTYARSVTDMQYVCIGDFISPMVTWLHVWLRIPTLSCTYGLSTYCWVYSTGTYLVMALGQGLGQVKSLLLVRTVPWKHWVSGAGTQRFDFAKCLSLLGDALSIIGASLTDLGTSVANRLCDLERDRGSQTKDCMQHIWVAH